MKNLEAAFPISTAFRDTLSHALRGYAHLTMRQVDLLTIDGQIPDIHLLRFERLQQDFDAMCDAIGIERGVLPTLNSTRGKDNHYMEYYDSETRRLVSSIYEKDFKIFGYEI